MSSSIYEFPNWPQQAQCIGEDPDIFLEPTHANEQVAKEICKRCVVMNDCLAYAIEHGIHYGIWGGKNESERIAIK